MAENEVLVARFLDEKAKAIEELNAMNDVVASARRQSQSTVDIEGIGGDGRGRVRGRSSVHATVTIPSAIEHEITAHKTEINDVAFVGAGVVTASSDGTCAVWDLTSGKQTATLRASHPVMCVDTCDSVVMGGSNDKVARVWDVETQRERSKLAGHGGKIYSCCLFGNGRKAVTGGTDRQIKVWDLSKRTPCVRTIYCPSIVNSVHTTPEGTFIVSGHQDGGVRLWDASTGQKVADTKIPGFEDETKSSSGGSALPGGPVTSVCFSTGDGGRRLLTCSRDDHLRVMDARTLAPLDSPAMSCDGFRVSLAWTKAVFSPGAYYACAGSSSGTVVVWDSHVGGVERQLRGHTSAVPCVAWSLDGQRIASGDKSGALRVWR